MKLYNHTTSSMKDRKLNISRRHFVSAAGLSPLAFATSSLFAAKSARADVMAIREDDNVLGDRNAPIAIIEYASLTCPHCANFHNEVMPQLQENYIDTGKAYLVYRDFPWDQNAYHAAVLAHTAGEKRFFPTLKILYSRLNQWASAPDVIAALKDIAKLVGVPAAKFEAALQDEKLGERILMDRMVAANEYDVTATPTIFINGERFDGDSASYEAFDEYLKGLM
ncbi:DsbA family protein [Sneathiella glossodoripedis]|uniref:DsbA family protein n=1 Tax=Sneathiella glossodoripedis TaxID=418853 RepID=UPI000566535F|nr:DsbA family protein [Sneathiella glossodoripedis]